MTRQSSVATLLFAAFLSLASPVVVAGDYKIENVQGDIYRFIDDRHRAVFLVTNDGILLTDPLNAEAAAWLKIELQKRFNVPVKYVVYSHNHSDHIYGAEVFDDPETKFIAHELAEQDIRTTRAKTVLPDVIFKEDMVISLGGHSIELRYHGPNDGRGSISMLFRTEKVLFVVDWIVLGRMPWQKLWSYDIQGMINSTAQVLELDFEIFVGGHADIGNKADVQRYLTYLQTLYRAVIDGIHSGQNLKAVPGTVYLFMQYTLIFSS
tara:strand:- start:192 stop:986 length:795 start_codon:yes stop_codon:yes gene_type:complete